LLLLDTHVWAWALTDDAPLTAAARQAMNETATLFLSAVTFYEISHKVRLGKWPQMAKHSENLPALADEQSLLVAPVTAEIALRAGQLDWPNRDPFDRQLAATSLLLGLPLISADPAFDSLIGLRRLW
jgi:PIN domain nuclease of toxin-antitoxin system